MKHSSLLLGLVFSVPLGLCGESVAQDLTPRAKPQNGPVVIINATVHPISEPVIENGFVYFVNGKISGVGTVGKEGSPKFEQQGLHTIDAKGKHVYPGLIGAHTTLGLEEMQSVRASTDTSETGGFTPEVRAATAVNPDSTLLPVSRAGVIRLDGWSVADMTVLADAGLVINWPQTRSINAFWMNQSEDEQRTAREKNQRAIEDMISGARAYYLAKRAGQQPAADIRYDAMTNLFGGSASPETRDPKPETRLPVFIQAQDYEQIQQAITLCVKHGLRCVLVGGRDAPMCADLLKRHNVSVIVDGTFKFPKRDDSPFDDAFTLPSRLEAAGIKWCLASGEETAHERNLPYGAAKAVSYGLDHEVALRSITLSPAEILGVADKYGSIAMDKSATLIVTDGDVLEVASHVTMAFLDGREVNLSDKQKVLDQRYREKYKLQSEPSR